MQIAENSALEILRTLCRASKMNARREPVRGCVRRECIERVLILGEAHLRCALLAYVIYFTVQRPHHRIASKIPAPGLCWLFGSSGPISGLCAIQLPVQKQQSTVSDQRPRATWALK